MSDTVISKSISIEKDLTTTFETLRSQEISHEFRDYLAFDIFAFGENMDLVVNEKSRQVMGNWYFRIIDYCDFSAEIGNVAMGLLDRFLSTREGHFCLTEKRSFQLASVCAFKIAVKVHEANKIDMDSLCKLCRGFYEIPEFHEMEKKILFSLGWRLHYPTPHVFLEIYLELLTPQLKDISRSRIRELVHEKLRASVQDYYFMLVKPSTVALASLLNVLEELNFNYEKVISFTHRLIATGMDCSNFYLLDARYRLNSVCGKDCSRHVVNEGQKDYRILEKISESHDKKNRNPVTSTL